METSRDREATRSRPHSAKISAIVVLLFSTANGGKMATTAIKRFTAGGRVFEVYRIDHENDCGYRYSRIHGRALDFQEPWTTTILRAGYWESR